MTMPNQPEWISVREAAVQLRITYGQVLRLMEIGVITCRKKGIHWQVEHRSVFEHAANMVSERERRGWESS